MQKILIFPYNGNGLEALDCLSPSYEFIGFIDDDKKKHGIDEEGHKIFSRAAFDKFKNAKILAVPGSPTSFLERVQIITSLKVDPKRFTTIIHPKASVSKWAKIGINSLIMAGSVLGNSAKVGDHVCILPGAAIHHHVKVGDYTLIGSNVVIAGGAHIGENCYIGGGSTIINDIKIGERSLIGLGTNVIRTIRPESRVVGNPARQI